MDINNMDMNKLAIMSEAIGVVVDEYKGALFDVMYTDWFKKNHPDIAMESDGAFQAGKLYALKTVLEKYGFTEDNFRDLKTEVEGIWEAEQRK